MVRTFTTFLRSQFTALPAPTADYAGATVVVTGANTGLGLEAARHFARLNAARVVLAVRTVSKGDAAKKDIEASTGREGVCEVWALDMSSYASVRAFVERAARELGKLDVAVLNAGVVETAWVAAEGHERTLTVNVLSTHLLATLLLPLLRAAAPTPTDPTLRRPHLVIVASDVHETATFTDWSAPDLLHSASEQARAGILACAANYDNSKLFEVLLVRELAKTVPPSEVVINTVNPGLCHSELGRDGPWFVRAFLWAFRALVGRTAEVGARNYLAAAVAGEASHGGYVSDCRVMDPSNFVLSPAGIEAGRALWDQVNTKLGLTF